MAKNTVHLIDRSAANFNKIHNIFSEIQTFKNPYRKILRFQ